jgi:hypothetical protein
LEADVYIYGAIKKLLTQFYGFGFIQKVKTGLLTGILEIFRTAGSVSFAKTN